jgi:hypothetical protein
LSSPYRRPGIELRIEEVQKNVNNDKANESTQGIHPHHSVKKYFKITSNLKRKESINMVGINLRTSIFDIEG